MSAYVARAIEAIRSVPWRGLTVIGAREPPPSPRAMRRGARSGNLAGRLRQELLQSRGEWVWSADLARRLEVEVNRIIPSLGPWVRKGMVETKQGDRDHVSGKIKRLYRIPLAAVALLLAACCGAAEAHDFYSGLRAPDGVSCCSDTMRECHTTSMCRLPDGKEGIMTSGWGCVPVPWGKVLGISSPDGRPSVCESPIHGPAPVIYCVLLGSEV